MARAPRRVNQQGKWLDVFLELGVLQADIMKTLNRKENMNRAETDRCFRPDARRPPRHVYL
jgi:hypothetical protein